jgi:hypothetical protein
VSGAQRPGRRYDELAADAAERTPDRVVLLVDDEPVRVVRQPLAYPMQFMLGIDEFPGRRRGGAVGSVPESGRR